MNYLFCGGRFHFDYLKEGYLSQAEDDYRVSFLGDVRKLLRGNGAVRLSEYLTYVGPFYFESDGMIDKEIVKKEMRQIQRCTHAIFLLEDGCCPGTVAEIIYAATHQKRISIFYIRDEKEIYSDVALNDIVLSRSKPLRGLRYVNSVNGKYLNTYAADGIIVATATGSTGYNLSVGGPIVSPEAQILLLTPIAAHSLISRSIVLPGTDQISIEIAEGKMGTLEEAVRVSFDGCSPIALNIGDRVTIRRSKWHTRLVKMKNTSFLETLRYKMREA